MRKLVKYIEFRPYTNPLLKSLSEMVLQIRNEDKLMISADKTSNHYKLNVNTHKQMLDKNIQKDYKKVTDRSETQAARQHKATGTEWNLNDRVFKTNL